MCKLNRTIPGIQQALNFFATGVIRITINYFRGTLIYLQANGKSDKASF